MFARPSLKQILQPLVAAAAVLAFTLPADGAPIVMAGLTGRHNIEFSIPPPRRILFARIEIDSLAKVEEIDPSAYIGGWGFWGGNGAGDRHGSQFYASVLLGSGGLATLVGDTKTNRIIGTVATYGQLAVDPTRARLYATTIYPAAQLTVIDTRSLQVVATIPLPSTPGGPSATVVTPDGASLYVVVGKRLSLLTLPAASIAQTTVLDAEPTALAVNPARNEVYLADYDGGRIMVVTADTLQPVRNLAWPGIYSISLRSLDGALLVESSTIEGTQLDAVDPVTGQSQATAAVTGYGAVESLDGRQLLRVHPGTRLPGEPFSATSQTLVILNSATLQQVAEIVLDTRAPDVPLRQDFSVVATFAVSMPKVTSAIEYFNPPRGHYFMSADPAEIAALDGGVFPGWQRTGESIPVYLKRDDAPDGVVPVCRFYGRPESGLDSHFYSASTAECAEVLQRFGNAWIYESGEVFDAYLPDATTGACPFETTPVYRLYNNRADVNHRYTTSPAIKATMQQQGWISEGYGDAAIGFCVPR
jgi:hypothetical protein